MNFINQIAGFIPFAKPAQRKEYFFALNIGPKNLQACIWLIDGKNAQVLDTAESLIENEQEITKAADQILDKVLLGIDLEPDKILFGVQSSWLMDDDLKPQYLKLLQDLSKYLDLKPLAFVATSNALAHFLEKKEGAPTTGILVGIEKEITEVTVVRAGKLDGTKIIQRSENIGQDIEKALLTFTDVEVLPSRVLLYGSKDLDLDKQKENLLSFPWMNKLSFLHFPKIEILEDQLGLKAVALAGASEIDSEIKFVDSSAEVKRASTVLPLGSKSDLDADDRDFGFVEGDINKLQTEIEPNIEEPEQPIPSQPTLAVNQEITEHLPIQQQPAESKTGLSPKSIVKNKKFFIPLIIIILVLAAALLLPSATVTIFAEPQILEKDAQVTADPSAKSVDEEKKIIPGEIVTVEVSGNEKASATGKKEIGDSAKGAVKVINNSFTSSQTISQGTTITSSGLKFTLDETVHVASSSATSVSKATTTVKVTAVAVGPESNLPNESNFTLNSNSQVAIVAEGNFSGGTSKTVTVVTDEDQKKLLASLASNLRKQAKDKIQEKLKEKKILEEALSEEITKKSYNKAIGDQAAEFSLTLNLKYKGTAYSEDALKEIVSKALSSQIPQDFELNLAETETSADVSKLEKDGKLIFLARFKAKLSPKIDTEQLKSQIRGKSINQAVAVLKKQPHIVGVDIKISPSVPTQFALLPILSQNIKFEVKLQ